MFGQGNIMTKYLLPLSTQTYGYIEISFFSEDIIDLTFVKEILNVSPSSTKIKGQEISCGGINAHRKEKKYYQASSWNYYTKKRTYTKENYESFIYESIEEIRKEFFSKADIIKELLKEYNLNVYVCVVLYIEDAIPYLSFPADFLCFLSHINAKLDFDIFIPYL